MRTKLAFVVLAVASTPVFAGEGEGGGGKSSFGDIFLTLQDILASIGSLFL